MNTIELESFLLNPEEVHGREETIEQLSKCAVELCQIHHNQLSLEDNQE